MQQTEFILETIKKSPISQTVRWLDLSGWCFESRLAKQLLAEIVAEAPQLDTIWIKEQSNEGEVILRYTQDEETGQGKVCVLDQVTHGKHCERFT